MSSSKPETVDAQAVIEALRQYLARANYEKAIAQAEAAQLRAELATVRANGEEGS